ncbi:histidine kinase [Candidatus Methylomirabilis lanthanidiphila]|uniref:Histidine kinase n=1 Tax=Candidatus Methylomirabilis lanthanidiphila TaxID=2211376 RepID=A0A564ZL50_9BACT|nr:response regulator [Candidatus Methylomirabilis lanthanidiphila]VUZ86060.1 histidine kinase [Candidatus Methylomirabilis lanthanidiphila]
MSAITQAVILIVEDDPLGRELAKEILHDAGYAVLSLEDGVGLLERVKIERPDIILMDLQLPGTDGVTLARQLKADDETRSIPVVMTTAYAQPESYVQAIEAGCAAYLTKPINSKLLLKAVATLLKR